jgi:hypothetical protein
MRLYTGLLDHNKIQWVGGGVDFGATVINLQIPRKHGKFIKTLATVGISKAQNAPERLSFIYAFSA